MHTYRSIWCAVATECQTDRRTRSLFVTGGVNTPRTLVHLCIHCNFLIWLKCSTVQHTGLALGAIAPIARITSGRACKKGVLSIISTRTYSKTLSFEQLLRPGQASGPLRDPNSVAPGSPAFGQPRQCGRDLLRSRIPCFRHPSGAIGLLPPLIPGSLASALTGPTVGPLT